MAFSFGAAPAASNTGFTLGAPPAKAPAASTPAFGGFGTPAVAATTAAAPAFGGFGAAPASSSATPAFGGFGAAASTTTSSAPAPAFGGFGAAATTSATPALGGFGAAAATSAPAPAFGGFGAAASTTTAAAPAFGGFGAAASTTSAAPPAFGAATNTAAVAPTLGGFGISSAPSIGGFGASTTSTTTTVSGLGGNTTGGGIFGAPSGQQAVAEENKTDATSSKESPIPAELNAVVEALKNLIKEEKSLSSEISHTTDKQIKQVKDDTEALSQLVTGLGSTLQNNRLKLDQLKQNCGQELVNVDICVKTRDTPPSMQYDNVAPMDYFSRLITQFEQSMLEYRQAIQTAELHLQDVTSGSGSGLSAEDIVSAVQRLHQALTHLAAKYQVIHTTINEYKCQFRVQSKHSAIPPSSLSGPSPFLAPADPLTIARQSLTSHGPPIQSLGQQKSAFNQFGTAPSGGVGGAFNSSGFGNSSVFGASSFGAGNTSFGANTSNNSISIGTKRNKH